jgi:hypothetical protein
MRRLTSIKTLYVIRENKTFYHYLPTLSFTVPLFVLSFLISFVISFLSPSLMEKTFTFQSYSCDQIP